MIQPFKGLTRWVVTCIRPLAKPPQYRFLTYTLNVCKHWKAKGGGHMSRSNTGVRKRVNVSLPEETLRLLDRIAKQGERSALITEAVTAYLREHRRRALRDRLKQGALARAERDRRFAEEWFPLEEDAWERGKAAPRRG